MRDLVAHQGMVHRWAAELLRGMADSDREVFLREGEQSPDQLAWFAAGAQDLLATLESVPDDVEALVFLKDAPAPRAFWARRQCHETTIHAVDALAAVLGRAVLPDDVPWIDQATAQDGIDELLTGFLTRGRSRFAPVGPLRLRVVPEEEDRAWVLDIAQDGQTTAERVDPGPAGPGEVPVRGTSVGLYLGLWNRTVAGVVEAPADMLATWAATAQIHAR